MATEATLPATSEYPASGSYELIRLVEAGLPLDCLEKLKQRGLTSTEIGQLDILRAHSSIAAREERLSIEESERFLRVMRVLELGERVFGARDALVSWLRGPDFYQPERSSMSSLLTDAGAQAVTGELWGVAEGAYRSMLLWRIRIWPVWAASWAKAAGTPRRKASGSSTWPNIRHSRSWNRWCI